MALTWESQRTCVSGEPVFQVILGFGLLSYPWCYGDSTLDLDLDEAKV